MSGSIFTIAQQKGGAGKTTLAAHLAVTWARDYSRSIAVLDVDPQGSLGEWLEAREKRFGENQTGLCFRTASGWGARREAETLAKDHDVVVIDTPPHADLKGRTPMGAADHIVVPVQPTPVDLWATRETLLMAERENTPAMLVLNRVPPKARLTGEMSDAINELGVSVSKTQLGHRIAFAESIGVGATATETHTNSKAAFEARALAHELMAWANSPH